MNIKTTVQSGIALGVGASGPAPRKGCSKTMEPEVLAAVAIPYGISLVPGTCPSRLGGCYGGLDVVDADLGSRWQPFQAFVHRVLGSLNPVGGPPTGHEREPSQAGAGGTVLRIRFSSTAPRWTPPDRRHCVAQRKAKSRRKWNRRLRSV